MTRCTDASSRGHCKGKRDVSSAWKANAPSSRVAGHNQQIVEGRSLHLSFNTIFHTRAITKTRTIENVVHRWALQVSRCQFVQLPHHPKGTPPSGGVRSRSRPHAIPVVQVLREYFVLMASGFTTAHYPTFDVREHRDLYRAQIHGVTAVHRPVDWTRSSGLGHLPC